MFKVNSIFGKSEEIKAVIEKRVDINKACLEELIIIPSIGEKTAQRILKYRENKGIFKNPEELLAVKGIGEKKLEIIRRHIVIK